MSACLSHVPLLGNPCITEEKISERTGSKKHCCNCGDELLSHDARSGLTTQAQRPSIREAVQRDCCSNCARDAMMATATPTPGSLQRMVRCYHFHTPVS